MGPGAAKIIVKELARTGSFDKAMLAATKMTGGLSPTPGMPR